MPTLPCQRHLFDIPDNIAYFNCAYNSPQLKSTTAQLLQAARAKSQPWQRTPPSFFEDADTLRSLAAEIFGGVADGYAIIPAASYGISSAAHAIAPYLLPGDAILVLAEEFPSNVLPWQRLCKEIGTTITTVTRREGISWTEAVLAALGDSVKVVALCPCHWTDGAVLDLALIGEACRRLSKILVIDATQALGAFPINLEKIQPDFLIAAGYKWLLGPYGFGLMYVDRKWWQAKPLDETWLARENARDFSSLVRYSDNYLPGARRFDIGETCTAILPGAIASLQQLKEWGVRNIAETLGDINEKIADHLVTLGCQVPEKAWRCPHMFGARLPVTYQGDLIEELKKNNIFISRRGNALRFAPHLHISNNDIDRLLAMLSKILG